MFKKSGQLAIPVKQYMISKSSGSTKYFLGAAQNGFTDAAAKLRRKIGIRFGKLPRALWGVFGESS